MTIVDNSMTTGVQAQSVAFLCKYALQSTVLFGALASSCSGCVSSQYDHKEVNHCDGIPLAAAARRVHSLQCLLWWPFVLAVLKCYPWFRKGSVHLLKGLAEAMWINTFNDW